MTTFLKLPKAPLNYSATTRVENLFILILLRIGIIILLRDRFVKIAVTIFWKRSVFECVGLWIIGRERVYFEFMEFAAYKVMEGSVLLS